MESGSTCRVAQEAFPRRRWSGWWHAGFHTAGRQESSPGGQGAASTGWEKVCFGEKGRLSAFPARGSTVPPQHHGVSEAHSGCGGAALVGRLQPAGGQVVGMGGAVLRQS